MYKVVVLGSGAAPGVPCVAKGWGRCDSSNSKNRRRRTSTYIEYNQTKIVIDTSPDLRWQMLDNNIKNLDGVLYTHHHADHLHGIDDLREINRITQKSLNFYANKDTYDIICHRFPYLITSSNKAIDAQKQPSLCPNLIEYYVPFYINDLKITPIKLLGHNICSTGYVFNDGDIVYIADYRYIEDEALKHINKDVKLMILPLTTPYQNTYHAGIEDVLLDIKKINPQRAVINHMAIESDYLEVQNMTPDNVEPAYDNLTINLD